MRILIRSEHKKMKSGFSTVELAVVLIISGLMFGMFLNAYRVYDSNRDYLTTVTHMEALDSSIKEYLWSNNSYPCPADPTLDPSHPDYGIDRDNDGNDDMVLIGGFPFRTLQNQSSTGLITGNYREKYAYDGYEMRFTYAVTEIMAAAGTFNAVMVNPHWGAITIVDENGNDVTDPPDSGHYVLVSHGENRRGAYTEEGVQNGNCIIPTAPVGVDDPFNAMFIGTAMDLEVENCDHIVAISPTASDAAFRKAIRGNNEGTPNFFDDIVYYKANFETSLWQTAANSGAQRLYQYNTNPGNVGIGNGFTTPGAKLHVNGDVLVAKKIESQEGFCDPTVPRRGAVIPGMTTPPECMQVGFVAGPTTQCADSEVAVAIDKNSLVCEPLFPAAPTINATCPIEVGDANGNGTPNEQQFATGVIYNRATNTVTAVCDYL